jgi:hypothetical protein
MAPPDLTLDELTKFGIRPADEAPHAFDPSVEWWNESWFWDWYDATGTHAGHCRIGIHPNQQRAWLWLFAFQEGEWVAIEEPRLPLADLDQARLGYDRWGLCFSWEVSAPLLSGWLRVEGFGRVLAGPRTGMILPVRVDLEIEAIGPPHSGGRATAAGHASERFPASRFEQPIAVRGTLAVGGTAYELHGRGERDHSWGPRYWNLEWTFLALNGEHLRLQCVDARIPDVGRFVVGYLQRDAMVSISEARFDLTYADDDVLRPVAGPFSVRTESGETFAARIEPLTAAEIDITHTFDPPRRSVYRRALIRVIPEGGDAPLLGWLESNRFVDDGVSAATTR